MTGLLLATASSRRWRGYEVLTFLAGPAASERLESVSEGKEGQA